MEETLAVVGMVEMVESYIIECALLATSQGRHGQAASSQTRFSEKSHS